MLEDVYRRLFATYGPQGWWPAESQIEIIVGAVLTQNTNWRNVESALENLRSQDMLSLKKLRSVEPVVLAELIRPSGFYRLKAKRLKNLTDFIGTQYGSVTAMLKREFQPLRRELLGVNGVGPETADSILLYAGNFPTFVVDAYTHRVMKRHGWIAPTADYATLKATFEAALPMDVQLFNEYHALLVRLGKQHCGRQPRCDGCPLEYLLPTGGALDVKSTHHL